MFVPCQQNCLCSNCIWTGGLKGWVWLFLKYHSYCPRSLHPTNSLLTSSPWPGVFSAEMSLSGLISSMPWEIWVLWRTAGRVLSWWTRSPSLPLSVCDYDSSAPLSGLSATAGCENCRAVTVRQSTGLDWRTLQSPGSMIKGGGETTENFYVTHCHSVAG